MKKFCVFCGKELKQKTMEHVIPKWLIELTGDPKRLGNFGPFLLKGYLEIKELPFENFFIPSCEVCNNKYSKLEEEIKQIISNLLNEKQLSQSNFNNLFTWFDKIRIGLWLSYFYIQGNIGGITPHFYINSRINQTDRALLIYKSDNPKEHLSFWGANTLAFQFLPSCFSLCINNYCFQNIATNFLFSKQLGLPYPRHICYVDDVEQALSIVQKGHERISYPILSLKYNKLCTKIFQPIIPKNCLMKSKGLFDTQYVKDQLIDYRKGLGKIFILDGPYLQEYPEYENSIWKPLHIFPTHQSFKIIFSQTLEFQNHLMKYGPIGKKIEYIGKDKKRKKDIKKRIEISRKVNKELLVIGLLQMDKKLSS